MDTNKIPGEHSCENMMILYLHSWKDRYFYGFIIYCTFVPLVTKNIYRKILQWNGLVKYFIGVSTMNRTIQNLLYERYFSSHVER